MIRHMLRALLPDSALRMTTEASTGAYPRSLSGREAEILQFLLGLDDVRLAPLREQAASAFVIGMCPCRCATIDLAVDRERTRPVALCSPVVSANTPVIEGEPVFGLVVFLDEGWLSGLEISYFDQLPLEFPPATAFDSPWFECDRRPGTPRPGSASEDD
jgi:hypothetical protein